MEEIRKSSAWAADLHSQVWLIPNFIRLFPESLK